MMARAWTPSRRANGQLPRWTRQPGGGELRGSVLAVLEALLGDFAERAAVLAIVGKLVADNTQLARRLARLSGFKKSEKLSTAQLVLFLDALGRGEVESPGADAESRGADALADADRRLRETSGIDAPPPEQPQTGKPPPQPHARTPAPEHLRRVDNLIAVPTAQRACPTCGTERVCIGHDVTEVIELIPAEVIVRRDQREKLACLPCEGEVIRAPVGAKIVANGKLGLRLVAQLMVEKYVDGLPLHRQRERLQRLGLELSVSTLADQVKWCTDLLRPLWRAALAQVIDAR